jgi:hypothetical protein
MNSQLKYTLQKYKNMTLVINVDKIEKIYAHKAKQATFVKYVEYSPAKYCFFGLIRCEAEDEGHWWINWDGRYQHREDVIDKNTKYYINRDALYENSIWEKPYLYIVMSHSDNITKHYETYEQMMVELNKMVEASNANLMIIKD